MSVEWSQARPYATLCMMSDDSSLPSTNSSSKPATRKIIHIDMDCFYAAIEMREKPELKDIPMAVGYPYKRGVLTTANYVARKFGIRSAMPVATALKKCPDLRLVEPRFELYKAESKKIRKVLQRYTRLIEPLSLDEAYLDVTGHTYFEGSASLLARQILKEIFEETQLTASAGVAPNKFIAKVASDWNKPNGLKTVSDKEVLSFVSPLKIGKIPGVGPKTEARLKLLGLETCADIQKFPLRDLMREFGEWGFKLHELSFGRDERPVEIEGDPKSISAENTFEDDLVTETAIRAELYRVYEDLRNRLKKYSHLTIGSCFIKVKTFDFKTFTRERSSQQMMSFEDYFSLVKLWQNPIETPIRLIGAGVRFKSADESLQTSFLESL